MTTPTDDDRARLRAHLDRGLTERPAWMLDCHPSDTDDCAWWRASFATFQHRAWRAWFADDEYLGEVSARVGPDDVGAAQRCDCPVCRGTVRP